MTPRTNYKEKLVFGLDIGTRSIVGTVGYKDGNKFIVVAQRSKEHETRAMLDGQIHDIHRVGQTIKEVKEMLEAAIGQKLHEVCIAAAGRVLRTITTHVDQEFDAEKTVGEEDVLALISRGIEHAYEEFMQSNETGLKFYCVGYSIVRYFMNGYPMGNLEDHKAKSIGADLIATFLPDDVVDGLYKAVELGGLTVANLTLEPIAAIQVAIPEKYRMLNMALVDVGAGTSDISITQGGSIVAYGMIPMAGDSMTDLLVQHCLTDFDMAEHVKRAALTEEYIEYTDIMGLPQTITREEVLQVIQPAIDDMTRQVSECIKALNGDKPVSAVFIVGGGGKIPGYSEALAAELGIQKERVALRGEEVMQAIEFLETDVKKDSLLVTPVGICLTFYEQSNNFIFVTFNEQRVKLYDNNHVTVVDAAIQADFPNDGLFPKRGRELEFTVNGKQRIQRGLPGEAAEITVNGNAADINTPIHSNDIIVVKESTVGEPASLELGQLPEYKENLCVIVNDKKVLIPRFALVNGNLQSRYYSIRRNDVIDFLDYCTVEQLAEFMDVMLGDMYLYVNNMRADRSTKVYENFNVIWSNIEQQMSDIEKDQAIQVSEEEAPVEGEEDIYDESYEDSYEYEEEAEEEAYEETVELEEEPVPEPEPVVSPAPEAKPVVSPAPVTEASATQKPTADPAKEASPATETAEEPKPEPKIPITMTVIVNNRPIVLKGKSSYVYVDVFEYIDFDLSKPQGTIVTTLNGRAAQYMENLQNGDRIEIYWRK